MTTLNRSLLTLGTLVGLLGGCGSGNALPGITPSIVLSSPTSNATVSLPANKQVAVDFNTNYTLKAPGTCNGLENCGHIYVLIDNTNCNQASLPYNNVAVASPAFADLSKCATPTGQHTVSLELHNDTGVSVTGVLGNPVTAQVMFTVQ